MNRTDRLLSIVLELQRNRHRYCRAEDLAAHFEVSKRTIYRDVQALCEAGVPIVVAERRGYTLVEGYFLPPLRFTPDEALILALGSEFVSSHVDADYRAAAQSAYRKIDAVLSSSQQSQVAHLKRGFHFATTHQLDDDQLVSLRNLRQAVAEHKQIRLHYSKHDLTANTPVQTIREVDPYNLTWLADDWYLTAYCHLRQAVRVFRLTRIDQMTVLERTFEPPSEGTTERTATSTDQQIFIQAVVGDDIAHWVRESQRWTLIDEQQTPQGVLMTLLTQSTHEVVSWLLSLGGAVRVLEPPWLQIALMEQAEQIVKHYRPALVDD